MASLLKLKTDIKKLKAAIASKATSGAIKTKLRGKLTTLENELDKLQPNKRKPKTTGPKSESALVKLAKKRRTNQGLSTSKNDIERDAIRPAKKAGKRISANGNRYYEYRDNRVDNRQPPKKYRKLSDGGELGEDYANDLKDFILEKYEGESVLGYKLTDEAYDGETPWLWKLKKKNIDVFAEPFNEGLEESITIAAYENEDEPIDKQRSVEFELTGDFDKDADKYLELIKPYLKKYSFYKKSTKPKVQPAVDVEVLKKRESDTAISHEIADIIDDYYWSIYKVGNGFEFDFQKLLEEVKAKKIQKSDIKNLETLKGTEEWKNEVLSKFGNIMSKKEREKLEKHDGRSVYMKGGYMSRGGLTKQETLKVAEKYAQAIAKAENKNVSVNMDTLEEDSFDLDMGGIKFDGGSYSIFANGDVKNMALSGSPIYGKTTSSVDEILRNMWSGWQKMAKGGKTKEQEIVRGYFEDEAYEYGDGGKVEHWGVYVDDKLVEKFPTEKEALEASKFYRRKSYNPFGIKVKKLDHGGYMADGGEIYSFAEKMTDHEFEKKLSSLNEKQKKTYESLVRLGDSPKLALATTLLNNEVKWSDDTTRAYTMADGGSVAKGNYEMLMSQAKEVMHHAEELMQVAKPDMDVEAWVVAKAERAATDLSDITHYLDGLKMAMGGMVKHNEHKVNA